MDKFYPYFEKDFSKYWFNYDNTGNIETFKIIKRLSDEEKEIAEYEASDNIYEIETSKGEMYHAVDDEILKLDEFDTQRWHRALMNLIDNFEYDDEMMELFVKKCNIEKFVNKYC